MARIDPERIARRGRSACAALPKAPLSNSLRIHTLIVAADRLLRGSTPRCGGYALELVEQPIHAREPVLGLLLALLRTRLAQVFVGPEAAVDVQPPQRCAGRR